MAIQKNAKLMALVAEMQEAFHQLKVPNDLPALLQETDLAPFNKVSGEKDYASSPRDRYEKNASRILDFLVFHSVDVIWEIIKDYSDNIISKGRAGKQVQARAAQYIIPASEYLDPENFFPHITSLRLYNKMVWIAWLFDQLAQFLIDEKANISYVLTSALSTFLKKHDVIAERVEDYRTTHQLPELTPQALLKALSIAPRRSTPSPSVAAALTEIHTPSSQREDDASDDDDDSEYFEAQEFRDLTEPVKAPAAPDKSAVKSALGKSRLMPLEIIPVLTPEKNVLRPTQLKKIIREVKSDALHLDEKAVFWSWSRSFFLPRRKATFREYLTEMVQKDFQKAKSIVLALQHNDIPRLQYELGRHRFNFLHICSTSGMTIFNQVKAKTP